MPSVRRPAALTRVLIADDEPTVVDALRQLIDSTERMRVIGVAASGHEAAALAAQLEPDVAIVDVRMPGGGPALIPRLHRHRPLLTVLVFTAAADDTTRERMLAAGAAQVLIKGENGDKLRAALRALETP